MNRQLLAKALTKFIWGFVLISLLLFLPAGTIFFRNGWLFIGLLFIPMLIVGIVLMLRNPYLLEKRLNAKETESKQKTVLLLSGIMFLSAFILAGLNHRFGWIVMPDWAIGASSAVFFSAYLMYAEVLRENTYLSRTVEVQKDQKVIDTGLYGIVRHPMYTSTIFLFTSAGLVLGSPVSFAVLLVYVPIIVMRIRSEEKVLAKELPGYDSYMKKVKYRLIPFIW